MMSTVHSRVLIIVCLVASIAPAQSISDFSGTYAGTMISRTKWGNQETPTQIKVKQTPTTLEIESTTGDKLEVRTLNLDGTPTTRVSGKSNLIERVKIHDRKLTIRTTYPAIAGIIDSEGVEKWEWSKKFDEVRIESSLQFNGNERGHWSFILHRVSP